MLRPLITLGLAVCTFVFLVSYNLPFSALFRRLHDYHKLFDFVQRTSEARTLEAKYYFGNMSSDLSLKLYQDRLKHGKLSIVISIVTVQRGRGNMDSVPNRLGYVLQSTALIDKIVKSYSFFENTLPFICNVDRTPQNHVQARALYNYIPYVERYGNSSLGVQEITIPGTGDPFRGKVMHDSKYQKEAYDYTFCLLTAAALNPDYVIMLEDDVLPHRSFPSVLDHLLTNRLKQNYGEEYVSQMAYLKLYYPLKWLGFGFDIRSLLDLTCYSITCAAFLYLCCYVVSQKTNSVHFSRMKHKFMLVNLLFSLVFIYLLGRQNIMEFRRLSKHLYRLLNWNACCTQAVLYPLHIIEQLSKHLVSTYPYAHLDLAIMDFVSNTSYIPLQVEPNLFHHAGLITTLNLRQKHPEEFIFHL